MGRHDTYLSAADSRPPAGRGRRGRRGGLPSLDRSATNRRPLPIRTAADGLDPFSGPRPSFDWADDVEIVREHVWDVNEWGNRLNFRDTNV
jgi:hypothetical protein